MKKIILSKLALALTLGASAASAQVKEVPFQLTGSDTLVVVTEFAIDALESAGTISAGDLIYNGIGSSSGQRQLEGTPNSSEPACTYADGCQEVAPMSRELNSAVCDDPEAPGNAEALAICNDAIVVSTSNDSLCGGDIGTDWLNKLRLLYTGCTDAACTQPRLTRCASTARANLINSWSSLVSGCTSGECPGGIRHAYRRDDNSGTTGVFLGFIEAPNDPATDLTSRTTYRTTIGTVCNVTPPTAQVYCDGGQLEGFFNNAATGAVEHGDPIRKACAAEDDLCNRDGTLGVVRAIRSVPGELTAAQAYPTVQCTRNLFRLATFDNTSCKVCPDGTTPIGGACFMPVYRDPTTLVETFNCVNTNNSRPPGAGAAFDGRAYNYIVHNTAGTSNPVLVGTALPEVAQWRQNMAVLNTGLGGANGGTITNTVCQENDATRNIGCLTGNTTCAVGYAGAEQVNFPTLSADNEALELAGQSPSDSGYAMGRKLFINAIGGFENVTADCAATGHSSSAFCEAQKELVNWFRVPANAAAACDAGGYAPLVTPECIGGLSAGGTVTCGSTDTLLSQCEAF